MDGDGYYRPGSAVKEPASYSTEELARHKEFTEAILRNRQIIREDTTDLDTLAQKLVDVATALQLTRELTTEMNLPELEQRLASIGTALKVIRDDEVVRELEAKQ
jgi:hypothetical protein